MILIYPPVSKPSEPPAGIAQLSGALHFHSIRHTVLDANLEGLQFLAERAVNRNYGNLDTWTRRAIRNYTRNVCALRDFRTYNSIDRYRRAVADVNRVLETSTDNDEIKVAISNYQDQRLSPLRSRDLLRAAEIPDMNAFYPYFSRRLSSLVAQTEPAIIGFSLSYLSQALSTFAMLGFLRREYPGLTLVCGGGLVTSWLRGPGWDNPFHGLVDQFVEGPGELAILGLCGIYEASDMHYTPEYGTLYSNEYISPAAILPYSASSGCFWNRCSFCPERSEDNCYRPVGSKIAREDISSLVMKHRPALVHLLDNSVSSSLMNALIADPLGAPWYGFARIDKELTDIDFCMSLKRSGCVMLKLGIESGDQQVLDLMQKGIDLETASLALKTLKRAGIASYVYLLFGTPEETLAGARRTLDFTVRHSDEISFLNLALFNMPAGCDATEILATCCFYEGDLSLYCDFEHPAGWNRKEVRRFIEVEFRRKPEISQILKNEPLLFTSNHAPFFAMDHIRHSR